MKKNIFSDMLGMDTLTSCLNNDFSVPQNKEETNNKNGSNDAKEETKQIDEQNKINNTK